MTCAPRAFEAEVVENRSLAGSGFRLTLRTPESISLVPGQFVQARGWEGADPLLRRPLAPHDVLPDGAGGTRIELLLTAIGRGTRIFSRKRAGDRVSLVGPLGKGFSGPPREGSTYLVAGGVGLAPIHHWAREARDAGRGGDVRVIVGARERRLLFGVEEVQALGVRVDIATDLGDHGLRGHAVHAFEAALAEGPRPALVLGCGPERMLESLVKVANREKLRCEVSLERRMACGFGVCYTCVARAWDDEQGRFRNVRTCIDGPVMDAARLPADAW